MNGGIIDVKTAHVRLLLVTLVAMGQVATVRHLGATVSGGDARVYLRLAADWLSTERLLAPSAFDENFWPAGYSGFLALFAWAGQDQIVLIRLVQVLMAACIALMAGRWVDAVSQKAGTATVAVVALSPTMLWAVWSLGYELLLAFLLASAVTLLWGRWRKWSALATTCGGALLGFALVVQFRVALAVLAVLIMLARTNRTRAVLALVGVMVPTTAWALRSLVATGNPAPWSTNGPYNLWNGNNPVATGRNLVPIPPLPEGIQSYSAAAIQWMIDNPLDFLALTGKKFLFLFEPTRLSGISEPFPGEIVVAVIEYGLAGFIMVMMAVFIVARTFGHMPRMQVLDGLFVFSMAYLLPNIFFIVEARFAIPVQAMLIAVSIGTVTVIVRYYSRARGFRTSGITLGKMSAATPSNGKTGNT